MRDPDLMQRADRAAGALEEAWERWRAMHGLGSEPLPPVSSYVGYSLEEPWGQPRVVFGLRADEAELLASLLDGHDCVGPIYAGVSALPDWRHQVTGSAVAPSPSYSVPPQAPPPDADRLSSQGYSPGRVPDEPPATGHEESDSHSARGSGGQDDTAGHHEPEQIVSQADPPDEKRPRRAARGKPRKPSSESEAAEDGDEAVADSPGRLAPLPDFAEIRHGQDELGEDDPAAEESVSATGDGPVELPAQGPGYRGPRYQGFPPRYDGGSGAKPADQVSDGGGAADDDAEAQGGRRPPVTKLSRTSRRRPSRS